MEPEPLAPTPRTAVVTGAGSGIGRAVARQLLEAGFAVALTGRREDALRETAEDRSNALVVPADISEPEQVAQLFDSVRQAWGRLDVLFNNAGTFGPAAAIDEIGLADWNATVAVNLTGAMLCAAEAFRIMKGQQPQGGRIINNGSISAHVPRPRSVAYAATKHALTGLTKSIELDGRPYGISCGQIDIGNTATAIMAHTGAGTGALQPDGSRRPEPTFDVEEAARAVVLMATLPAQATINQLTITAAGMPYIGRG
ncbi:short-chain alcohol dehydrogenase [Arthrobacter crystallopoietes BAB-32]|uniref:Short-chain alcohol dehydrogenase n=1 Tax=Arthrobacter crystallopoietes BAB-32 TaxID=1246476 RepID=N1UUN8_9MICC|nr:SDR family oxidoreductase [Arthrobacter crystallopoietes]EMY32745.1 short-chain alcohol dehydrogenase [Arthrobacter crystallopoietes BAB-32]